jgi:predicted metal-dependent phosphoesterase TrpH
MIFDLHIHSEFSWDCNLQFEKIIKIAKKKCINGIALTDHNSMSGLKKKYNLFKKSDIILIPGVEITINDFDFLVYFIEDEDILKIKDSYSLIDSVHSLNGIIALAHPYRKGYKLPDNEILERIDAIEVFNSRSSPQDNRKAQLLKNKLNKIPIGGSDAHIYGYIGLCKIMIEGIDIEEIRKNILNNEVKVIGCYPNYSLKFKSRINSIRYMSNIKKSYYLHHPTKAIKRLIE